MSNASDVYEQQALDIVAAGPHGLEECDGCGVEHFPPAAHARGIARRLRHEDEVDRLTVAVLALFDLEDADVVDLVVSNLYHDGNLVCAGCGRAVLDECPDCDTSAHKWLMR